MATAASRTAVSPLRHARAHRSALRLAVAEMQPAKATVRASISTASVDGNTLKPGATVVPSRAYTNTADESFSPTIRAPKVSTRHATSLTCHGSPDWAGK